MYYKSRIKRLEKKLKPQKITTAFAFYNSDGSINYDGKTYANYDEFRKYTKMVESDGDDIKIILFRYG